MEEKCSAYSWAYYAYGSLSEKLNPFVDKVDDRHMAIWHGHVRSHNKNVEGALQMSSIYELFI